MFKDLGDIQAMLDELKKLLRDIDDHKDKKFDKKATEELLMRYKAIESGIAFMRDFSDDVIRQQGIKQDDILRERGKKGKAQGKAQKLIEEADRLRCEFLVSQAGFIREQFKEFQDASRPYQETSKRVKKRQAAGQKKQVKKKFKKMHERMKWKKM